MYTTHIVPDKTRKKLEKSGLSARVKENLRKDKGFSTSLNYLFSPEDFLVNIDEMKHRGFFDQEIPFKKGFLNQIYSWNERYSPVVELIKNGNKPGVPNWVVEHSSGRVIKKMDFEHDLPFLTGYFASHILTPSEFWKPEKFGFETLGDLWGSLGVLLREMSTSYMDKNVPKWKRTYEGKTFLTEVTGSEHGDFRLFRTDIADYKTKNPLGEEVFYRPILREDQESVSAYHSVEPTLLAAVLKWARQEKISITAFDSPKQFLKMFEGAGKFLGNFGDAGDWGIGGARGCFIGGGYPLARLDENSRQIDRATIDVLSTTSKGFYQIAVDCKGDLVFSYVEDYNNGGKGAKRSISLRIPKQEANELVLGLFEQARNGLGRTSFRQLEEMLEFTQTEQFQQDLQRSISDYQEVAKN